ncbi:peptidoglycan DD-metalloendopeptidase family protein [Altererythrobacter indicus]|uniref:Peptidoglycan DD-metalloendopeptidase family protein n=1 Tax=Altericroceibacterium indicum TaxID=374177 RepID=A0A845A9C1_9SPHN|nr:M23 family metallopeptidase [Altericroceibacterium indicum]MXP25385.1 peptidoglycan DD-metalloendopeptidase family protein [Altericroceibacterium indicum]
MASRFLDRLSTIAITATLTSAAWVVFGGFIMVSPEDEQAMAPVQRDAAVEPRVESLSGSATKVTLPDDGASAAVPHDEAISQPGSGEMRNLMIPVLNVRPADLVNNFEDENTPNQKLHEAIDIMAPAGTSVVAAAPGRVERLFTSDAGGNTIYVRSEDQRTIFYYAHLAEFAKGLQEGQRIRRGQRLGSVGSSGNADPDAPHLHFAILRTSPDAMWWEPATALNPYPLLTKQQT